MKLGRIERHTGRFFSGLQGLDPPRSMLGIGRLAVSRHSPHVEFCRRKDGRKRRPDLDASGFDPAGHQAIIGFTPTEDSDAPPTGACPERCDLTIADAERDLARFFGGLTEMRLPDALRGLRCLTVEGRCPRVEIRVAKRLRNKLKPGRKLRGNANAGIFDPDIHLIVVDFGESHDGASAPSSQTRLKMERQLEECFGAEARRRCGRFAPIRIRGANVSDAVIEDRR